MCIGAKTRRGSGFKAGLLEAASVPRKCRAWIRARSFNQGKGLRGKARKMTSSLWATILASVLTVILAPILFVLHLLHDTVMMRVINRTWIYNMSWEDPRIDQRVLNLGKEDHVITISSAGDNVLDYLVAGARVTAVDFNACQIALTEMKSIAIQNLPFEDFFKIFAESDMALLKREYLREGGLRSKLTPASAQIWDEHLPRTKNLMYSGTSGQLAWFIVHIAVPILGLSPITRAVRQGATKEEVDVMVDRVINNKMFRIACHFGDHLMRSFMPFAGVPKRQAELGGLRGDDLSTITLKILKSDLAHDNYFYGGYIMGKYTKDCCPRYLKKENYAALRNHLLSGGLTLFHGTMVDALETIAHHEYTVASLLDHMDWMPPQMIADELAALMKRMDPTRGRLLWRSYSDHVHSLPLTWMQPEFIDEHDCRVGMYFSCWLVHLKDTPYTIVPHNDRLADQSGSDLLSQLATGVKVVTFPLLEKVLSSRCGGTTEHARQMESFYAHQKEGYDAFRERMLAARPWMMYSFPTLRDGGMVWVDVGGGTARNLEFFPPEVARQLFKRIYIVDISTSLLEIAAKRVRAMGLEDLVTIVEHDVTSDTVFEHLPPGHTVDVCTMSYSWSMIPDKMGAVHNIVQLLKPEGEGHLLIADFFKYGRNMETAGGAEYLYRASEGQLHAKWFAQDHVHLLSPSNIEMIRSQLDIVWDERRRGSVPFLPLLRPYHGVMACRTRVGGPDAMDSSMHRRGINF
jgi:betaine lipid synthase